MKFPLIICLIGGILLIHAGATISFVMDDVSCVRIMTSAEEEEESHYTKKISRLDIQCSAHLQDIEKIIEKAGFYKSSVLCNYESNRIDLPPEV